MKKHHSAPFSAYKDTHQGAYVACRRALHTSRAIFTHQFGFAPWFQLAPKSLVERAQ